MAKVAKRIIIPINALDILPLADSNPCLSPPDKIHWIAPIIIINKNITEAITKASPIALGIIVCKKAVGEDCNPLIALPLNVGLEILPAWLSR